MSTPMSLTNPEHFNAAITGVNQLLREIVELSGIEPGKTAISNHLKPDKQKDGKKFTLEELIEKSWLKGLFLDDHFRMILITLTAVGLLKYNRASETFCVVGKRSSELVWGILRGVETH